MFRMDEDGKLKSFINIQFYCIMKRREAEKQFTKDPKIFTQNDKGKFVCLYWYLC